MDAFIQAIPWRYALEMRKKRIESVKDALQEVKLLQMTEEEGAKRGASQVLQSDAKPSTFYHMQAKKPPKRSPMKCWGCEQEGHILRNCPLLEEWKESQRREKVGHKDTNQLQLNLTKRPLGLYVAHVGSGTPRTVTADIQIADVNVKVLIDSCAMSSCCSYQWYCKNRVRTGGLVPDPTMVVGVGNLPIKVSGRTQLLPLEWKGATARVTLLVIPTLANHEVILSMDILSLLGVKIDTRMGVAKPTVVPTYTRPLQT